MQLLPLGDRALLLQLAEEITEAAHARVRAVTARLEEAGIAGVVELVPAFTSVAVHYDPVAVGFEALGAAVSEVLAGVEAAVTPLGRTVELPVCYGGEQGPDLDELARKAGMEPQAFAEAHAAATYTVYMLGFAPGFPYLAGLPEALHAPRRASPRLSVPAGSVGIAGGQTGVYPLQSPGGWQLIGRTPRRLFDPARPDEPTLLRLGDRVRFRAISAQDFAAWEEG